MLVLIKKYTPRTAYYYLTQQSLIMLVLIKKDTPRTTYYYLIQQFYHVGAYKKDTPRTTYYYLIQQFYHVGAYKERHTQNNLLLSHPTVLSCWCL